MTIRNKHHTTIGTRLQREGTNRIYTWNNTALSEEQISSLEGTKYYTIRNKLHTTIETRLQREGTNRIYTCNNNIVSQEQISSSWGTLY